MLDDAQSLSTELLELVSGLIAESPADLDGDAERTYLPNALGATMPGPLLIVCTVWEHRLARAFDDPFQVWLGELQELGVRIAEVPCGEISPADAAALCARWDVDPDRRDDLIDYLKRPGTDASINQLVLAAGIGQLEERRDPMTGELALDPGEIGRVAQLPEQHLRDRLEAVRELDGGPHALSVLRMTAEVGPAAPVRLLHELMADAAPELTAAATSVLVDHQLLTIPDGVAAPFSREGLRPAVVDPDIQRLVGSDRLTRAQADRLFDACCRMLTWLCDEFLRDDLERSPTTPMPLASVERALAGVAAVVLKGDSTGSPGDPSARLAATVIARADLGVELGSCSVPSVGYAYAMGVLRQVDVARLELACAHYGASRITLLITRRALTTEIGRIPPEVEERMMAALRGYATHEPAAGLLADALRRRGQSDEAIRVLRMVHNPSERTILLLARLLSEGDREYEAVELLSSHAGDLPTAATRLADVLFREGRTQEAIDVLEPLVGRFPEVPMKLADLLSSAGRPDEAVPLLRPVAGRFQDVGPRLADLLLELGKPDEAMGILEPLVGVFETAPAKLAEIRIGLGRLQDAEAVLTEALAVFPTRAAEGLARLWLHRGEPRQAIEALRAAAGTDSNAATKLSRLLVAEGQVPEAIDVLLPFAHRASNNSTEVAELLIQQGRSDEAVELLEEVAGRFRNAAVRLAQLVLKSDPDRAIHVLRPWSSDASVAATLAGTLLRSGDVATARELLEKIGEHHNAETRSRVLGLKAAAQLLGGADDAVALLRDAPRRKPLTYYAAMSVLCECARLDLVALVVGELADRPIVQRTAADFFLTLGLAHEEAAGELDLRELARTVWVSPPLAASVVRQLRSSLWAWVKGAKGMRPPMRGDQALSCLEVLVAFDLDDRRLYEAVVAKLSAEAGGSTALFARLLNVQLISDVANSALSRASVPPDWRFA